MAQDLNTARRAEHTVARCTTYLLFACLLLEAGTLASTFSHRAELRVTTDEPVLPETAAPNDTQTPGIAKLKLAALLGTGILWLLWLRQAYRNLALVGSKRSRFTPRQAIGYWFIPFVNVVWAYQVMKDLWLRSESMNDRDAYDQLPAPSFLSAWWGIFLADGGLAIAVPSLLRQAGTPADLIDVTDLGIVVNLVGAVAVLLAIGVVRGIDRRQQCFEATLSDLPAAVQRAAHTPRLHA